MTIGRLQQDFIRKESEGLSGADKIRLQGALGHHKTGCSMFHSRSPDGEELSTLFDACPVLARQLRIPTTARKYGAVAAMGLLLRICIRQLKSGTLCVTLLPRSISCTIAPAKRQAAWFFLK